METLREVIPGLWVSDIESARIMGADFDLVIDCTGRGPTRGNGSTVSVTPKGKSNHDWTEKQLTKLAEGIAKWIRKDKTVLIHCQRGVSRSSVVAAAVLLWMGLEITTARAIRRTRWSGRQPANQTVGSLKRWWAARGLQRQQQLFKN